MWRKCRCEPRAKRLKEHTEQREFSDINIVKREMQFVDKRLECDRKVAVREHQIKACWDHNMAGLTVKDGRRL